MEALAGLAAFAVFAAVFFAFVGGIGYWILGPMHRATYQTKRSTQFFVTDFFWLVGQLQIALAAVAALSLPGGSFSWVVLAVASWAAVIAMWWASVTALSRARVRSPLRRATFVLFVVPMATLGVVAVFIFNFVGCIDAVAGVFTDRTDRTFVWLLVLDFPAAVLFYCCRRLTFWILAGGENRLDQSGG
jgi:hypothetical protein